MTEQAELRGASLELSLPEAARTAYDAAVRRATDERWVARLFDRDVSLWSADRRVQAGIAERLGWLDAPDHFTEQIPALEAFGEAIRDAGFTAVIVGGMGGSSLAPDVLNDPPP
jgi:glucose-6-phosphate isomerase